MIFQESSCAPGTLGFREKTVPLGHGLLDLAMIPGAHTIFLGGGMSSFERKGKLQQKHTENAVRSSLCFCFYIFAVCCFVMHSKLVSRWWHCICKSNVQKQSMQRTLTLTVNFIKA